MRIGCRNDYRRHLFSQREDRSSLAGRKMHSPPLQRWGKRQIESKSRRDGRKVTTETFAMDYNPLVSIVMGSDSDLEIMNEAAKALAEFGIPYEIDITSAHRSPARTSEYSRGLKARGVKVVIAGAGGAAHLAGVIAAETTLPVIAVPIPSTALLGLDSLLAMVQMPAGIPVATVAIGKPGRPTQEFSRPR